MLSKKYFFGVVQRFTLAESVQQFSWKHGLALGIMNASERTVNTQEELHHANGLA